MRGRIRTFKPELFFDEKLWLISGKNRLPILQGFLGLWSYADREGRFEWKPGELRALILPYWAGDFETILNVLADAGMVAMYEVEGRRYGLVRNLARHQSFNAREPESELPEPPDDVLHMRARADICTHEPPHVHAPVEGKGRELEGNGNGNGNGKARGRRAHQPIPIPDDLTPNEACVALAHKQRVSLETEFPAFVDHHTAKGSRFVDWQSAIRTWIRNAAKWGPSKRVPGAAPASRIETTLQRQADRVQQLRAEEAAEEAGAS